MFFLSSLWATLLLVGTALTLGEAADRLGSAVRPGGVTRTLASLRTDRQWDGTALLAPAAELHGPP
mgnify:CR=1 FL=1